MKNLVGNNTNKIITTTFKSSDNFHIYPMKDIRSIITKKRSSFKIEDSFNHDYVNFASYSIMTNMRNNPNSPYIASFGSFTKMFLFTGTFDWEKQEVVVGEIWEYFSDGFNFEDSSNPDNNLLSQPLGNWNKSIFDTGKDIGVFPTLPSDNNYYMMNRTFNDFKKKTGIGRDFNITGKRLYQDKFIRSIKFHNNGVEYE